MRRRGRGEGFEWNIQSLINKLIVGAIGIAVLILGYLVLKKALEVGISIGVVEKVLMIIALIIAFSIHEYAHAFAAYLSGDDTAKDEGRLSLNIFRHLDPVGIMFPIILILIGAPFIFGWARPVPINYMRLKNGRLGEFLVAIAGVTANFLMGLLVIIIIKFFPQIRYDTLIERFMIILLSINVSLGVFNLLPIPPLDGSRVIGSLLKGELRYKWFSLDRYGYMFILIGSYMGITEKMMIPLYNIVFNFYGIITNLLSKIIG